ncbi:hypothetical protein ACOMHN_056959 [Nucella lapillus]
MEYAAWIVQHLSKCDKNFKGSSGMMEVEAARVLWRHSVERYKLRYTVLLSDGDAKTFTELTNIKPYGDEVHIEKEECINHVSKRLGSALRNLMADCRKKGVTLGGRGHGQLTHGCDAIIFLFLLFLLLLIIIIIILLLLFIIIFIIILLLLLLLIIIIIITIIIIIGTPGVLEGCDGDIKKIVASFVHRQFGQSKRISEKDKMAVERFVSEQLWGKSVWGWGGGGMCLVGGVYGKLEEEEVGDEEVFEAVEVQDHLFRIHLKIKPHLHDPDLPTPSPLPEGDHNNIDNNSSSSNNNIIIINSGCGGIRERLLPDDLSFEIIHKEMDRLCLKLRTLEDQVRQSMGHFKAEVQETSLPELVGRMHQVLRKQQTELEETENHNRRLLDEVHRYSDHIEKLEKERKDYRAQVNVLHQDMAKLRQEKKSLQERFWDLEQSHKERLEKESTLDNLRLMVRDL